MVCGEISSFLQGAEGHEKFSLGSWAGQGLRRSEKVLVKLSSNDKPIARSRALVIHLNFELRGERGFSQRKNGRRYIKVVTNLLRIRSPKRIEAVLLRNGEDGLCSGNGSQEALPLFLEFQDQSPNILSYSGYVWKQRGFRQNWEMGNIIASHTIDFIPRSAIKSQVLADFIVTGHHQHLRWTLRSSKPFGSWNVTEPIARMVQVLQQFSQLLRELNSSTQQG